MYISWWPIISIGISKSKFRGVCLKIPHRVIQASSLSRHSYQKDERKICGKILIRQGSFSNPRNKCFSLYSHMFHFCLLVCFILRLSFSIFIINRTICMNMDTKEYCRTEIGNKLIKKCWHKEREETEKRKKFYNFIKSGYWEEINHC